MYEGTPQNIMQESNNLNEPQRRRSARLSPPQANITSDNKMAPPAFVKRRITVRKIAPRKTTLAPSEHNKENTPRKAVLEEVPQKKQKVLTPNNVPERKSSSGKKKKATMPSPILPSPPPPPPALTAQTSVQVQSQPPATDPDAAVWSQKVRRSYSRLSDKSFNSPDSRETLFGFEKLQTPEVIRKEGQSRAGLEASGSFSTLASFTSLLEAEDCNPEPDLNIPGVAVVKEKRRRKKVQQIDSGELDALAAKMNAEFEEAEEFELFVE